MHAGRIVQEAAAAELRDRPQAGFVSEFLAAALP
jgi:ABC-type proline/glycine betaine transport system ATPase subunit